MKDSGERRSRLISREWGELKLGEQPQSEADEGAALTSGAILLSTGMTAEGGQGKMRPHREDGRLKCGVGPP